MEPHVSRARDLIDRIIKTQIAPVLKDLGFRKERRLWLRPSMEAVQMVALQASQWSIEDQGQFTFNVGVHWATPYDHVICQPWPRSANAGYCVFCQRIGFLLPCRCDKWWEVNYTAKLDEIGQDAVQSIIQFGLPVLGRFSSLSAIREYLHKPGTGDRTVHNSMRLMVMHAQFGLNKEFNEIWRSTQAEAWHPEARKYANWLAHRLALDYQLRLDRD